MTWLAVGGLSYHHHHRHHHVRSMCLHNKNILNQTRKIESYTD